ncbi:rhombosortase [Alteromonas oceanisediminis]|uniref:rhombosortase n=1 Tax=Alteromonas oceanisediminis TaxID=2836180 RepID=UPI001BDA31CD|nr:rhombosortase [Alteromonas oceanisediminis]MBT0586382.1 rhombosortase [Alteromonas oceanisediminis]
MLVLPTQIRYWIGPLCVAMIAILGFVFEPWSSQWFAFNRATVNQGELWRLLSAHLLHTNAIHLLLNIAGLALLWGLHGEYYRPARFSIFFSLCAVLTSLAIWLFSPQLTHYVGLSGVLHGLFVWGACGDIRRGDHTGWLLLIGLAIKICYEQFGGDSSQIAALIEASVAVDAHLWGVLSGLLLSLLWSLLGLTWREPLATSKIP